MRTRPILLSQADIGPAEEEYALDALRSGWVAPLGPHVDAFEAELAARLGVGHALALASVDIIVPDEEMDEVRRHECDAWPFGVGEP